MWHKLYAFLQKLQRKGRENSSTPDVPSNLIIDVNADLNQKPDDETALLTHNNYKNYSGTTSEINPHSSLSLLAMLRRWLLREALLAFFVEKLFLLHNQKYQQTRKKEPLRNYLLLSNAMPLRWDEEQKNIDYEACYQQEVEKFLQLQIKNFDDNADEIKKILQKGNDNLEDSFAELKNKWLQECDTTAFELQLKQQLTQQLRNQQQERLAKLKHLHNIYILRTALNHFTYSVLPFSWLGLMLNDAIAFKVLPTRRYGMPAYDLLTGFYRKAWGQAGGFYDGFPNAMAFWVLPASILLAPLILIAFEKILQSYYIYQPEKIYTTLNTAYEKNQNKNYFRLLLQLLPYSPYRNALTVSRFLLQWDSQGADLRDDVHEKSLLALVNKIAAQSPLLLAVPAIATLAYAADTNSDDETAAMTVQGRAKHYLQHLANDASSWRGETAHYYRWTLGQPTSGSRHIIYGLGRATYTSIWLYSIYRVAQMYAARGQQANNFFSQERDCRIQQRDWYYSPISGEYDCRVCSRWSFVPAQLTNDPQACLDGLLAVQRLWEELFDGLAHLQHFSGYTHLDFSAWNFASWNTTITQQVFDALAPLAPRWQVMNFSTPVMVALWPDHPLDPLTDFLNKRPTLVFDISRQNMGADAWFALLNHWHGPANLTGLFSSQNGLTDQSMVDFATWYSNYTGSLNAIDFSGNFITNNGLTVVLNVLRPQQTHFFTMAQNQLTGQSLTSFANWLPTSGCIQLAMGEQDLSDGDFVAFGSAVAQTPSLQKLNWQKINLDSVSLVAWARSWSNRTVALTEFIADNNAVTGEGIADFGLMSAGNRIHRVNWSNNPITDAGLSDIQQALSHVTWTEINISKIPVSARALANFWRYLPGSSIRSVIAREFNFGDEAFVPLIALFEQHNITLDRFDASGNWLSNKLAGRLMQSACRAGVQFFSLENGRLSNMFDFLDFYALNTTHARKYHCTHLYLAGNFFNDKNVAPLLDVLTDQPFHTIDLSNTDIGDDTAIPLAQTLLSPIQNPNDLITDYFPPDETRALNQLSHPTTQLNEIVLKQTRMTARGKRALSRVAVHLPHTTLQFDEDVLHVPEVTSSFFNTQARVLPATTNNNTAPLSASFLLAAVPLVNTVLLAIVLYFLLRSIKNVWSANRSTFFEKNTFKQKCTNDMAQNNLLQSSGGPTCRAATALRML